jgi:hypothetical protein
LENTLTTNPRPRFFVHARVSSDDEVIVAAADRKAAHTIAEERRKEGYRVVWVAEDTAGSEATAQFKRS